MGPCLDVFVCFAIYDGTLSFETSRLAQPPQVPDAQEKNGAMQREAGDASEWQSAPSATIPMETLLVALVLVRVATLIATLVKILMVPLIVSLTVNRIVPPL